MSSRLILLTVASFLSLAAFAGPAEGDTTKTRRVPRLFQESRFSGEFQTDMQYCLPASDDDRSEYVKRFLSNSYLDLHYTSRMLDIGTRVEAYENPLPGFERDFKGVGVPYLYLSLNLRKVQFTAGDFYEQFGSGLILRSYYERSLGVDNALRGGRITAQPTRWLSLKVLAGKQRYYWSWSDGVVAGADAALAIDQMAPRLSEAGHRLQIGGSWVSKWEDPTDILVSPTEKLNLPGAVAAFSSRLGYGYKDFDLQAEYAYKINDPSADNNYIYRPGQALLLTASYAVTGFGITLGAKHTDNMSFRSDRTATGRMQQINFLPAFSRQQTYALANLYPYATQPQGEVAFQGDVFWKIRKGTLLGGKYGTDLRLNFARIQSPDKDYCDGGTGPQKATYGYSTHLFAVGSDLYYQDVNLDISHRFSPGFKMTFFYMNQTYDQLLIEGHADNGNTVRANIFVLEGTKRLGRKVSLRVEAQCLLTRQDKGDWVAGLAELSVSPHFIFTLTDLYNTGAAGENYLLGSVTYKTGAHRLQFSAGQQRAGIACVGGICRYVPATKGFMLNYSVNFTTK